MNFCISSMGRSGTKFLSKVLNQSRTWTVLHEPHDKHTCGLIYKDRLHLIQHRINNEKYGEVNSFLRMILKDLNVTKKGVITRDPRHIHISSYNKRKGILDDLYYRQMTETFIMLDELLSSGIIRIRFEIMIKNPIYLTAIANYFNIEDIRYTIGTCRKRVNARPNKLVKIFDELPKEHQDKGMDSFENYLKKYFINEIRTRELEY